MKYGSGIKNQEDKSSGTEILIPEGFAKINPTEPLRLDKQVDQWKRNWPDSFGSSLHTVKKTLLESVVSKKKRLL